MRFRSEQDRSLQCIRHEQIVACLCESPVNAEPNNKLQRMRTNNGSIDMQLCPR